MLRLFIGFFSRSRALRLEQARGLSAAARIGGRAPRLGPARVRALRPHDPLYPYVKYEMQVQKSLSMKLPNK